MPTSRAGNWSRGFTLLELSLALVVIGVLTAMVVPALDTGASGRDVAAAARKLSGLLAEGRNAALTGGRPAQLVVNLGSGRARVVPAGQGGADLGRRPPAMSLPDGMTFAVVHYPEERVVTEGVARVRLQAGGLAEPALIGVAMGRESWTLRVRAAETTVPVYRGLVDFEDLDGATLWE